MASTSTGMTRMQSFPFDSKADGYDADGYPVYDRAVGASMLRSTFAKFFSNGVFPSPGDALQIGKGASGLTVTIQPGIAIIDGAMGGVEGDDPITLTLDTAAPQGNVCYGIMLRYDNTDDKRSLYFNVVRGDAAAEPSPPAPDQSSPEVFELRLGYAVLQSNATDMSAATVVNEKGLEVCPYAAPFMEVDLSQVVSDAKNQASEILADYTKAIEDDMRLFNDNVREDLQELADYIERNKDFVDSALDDTTAGYLQEQINAIGEFTGMTEVEINTIWDTPYPEGYEDMTEAEINAMFETTLGGQVVEDGN